MTTAVLQHIVEQWLETDLVCDKGIDRVYIPDFFEQNQITKMEIQRLWDEGNVDELEKRMR